MTGPEILSELAEIIRRRFEEEPEGSYVVKLKRQGRDRILQKIGEEAVETVLAGKNPDDRRFISEAADLIFHLVVAFQERGLPLSSLFEELGARRK